MSNVNDSLPATAATASLTVAAPSDAPNESRDDFGAICLDERSGLRCRACGERMRCIASQNSPSWYEIMNGDHRPKWYVPYHRDVSTSVPDNTG